MIAVDDLVGALRPIGLDDLVARAALLTRTDRKYLVPLAELPSVLGGLPGDVRVLEIDRRHAFGYRSVYFDTPDLDSYFAAARRRRRRFKLRVRSYLDTDRHYFEVKLRGPRGTTIKHRIPYADGDPRLTQPARAHATTVLAEAGIGAEPARFRPVLTTRYLRSTLYVPSTGDRVTIDSGLAWILPDGRTVRTLDQAIVETKTPRATSPIDRLLWSLRYRPCAVSKYGTGLAALRPELPANHWHPVLRRLCAPADLPRE
ncbi:polyphosphate polymerase domain-containing protein [Actinomycetes bacterium KLBMP 9797]